MNTRDLSTNTMVSITEQLTAPPEKGAKQRTPRAIIEGSKLLAPHLPMLEEAHAGVLALTAPTATGRDAERLAALALEEATEDARHDTAVRGGYGLLSLAVDATTDPAAQASLAALRDGIYPDGQGLVNQSYTAESGAGRRLHETLDAPTRKRLKGIVLTADGAEHSAAGYADAQVAAAKRLGVLEAERQRLERGAVPAGGDTTPAVNKHALARQAWGQTVQLFATTVMADKSLSPPDRSTLLALLLRETERATSTGRSSKKDTPGKGPDGGADPKPDSTK